MATPFSVHRLLLGCLLLLGMSRSLWSADFSARSPDQRIQVLVTLDEEGRLHYSVSRDGLPVLLPSRLGLVRDDADFTRGLSQAGEVVLETVRDSYELPAAKRLRNDYHAQRLQLPLCTPRGRRLDLVFQLSNDGVAFRYQFPDPQEDNERHRVLSELSSFRFPSTSKAWLQPMSVPKTGFAKTNPSYEEYYEQEQAVGTPSNFGCGWVFPALFRSGDTWVALTETGLRRGACAARLHHESPEGEYSIAYADPRETLGGQGVTPIATLPWNSPWRVIALGSLGTLVESTLGTDLAPAAITLPAGPELPKPGKSSWSWPLLGDGNTVASVQRRFIDFAAHMGWEYCLVDALWDTQIGYEEMKALADHAKAKGVKLLVWYNSNGSANEAPQTPLNKMDLRETRLREFERLKQLGVSGLKIDFFGGDGRPVIDYYIDLLEDSAPYGFAMNFHGCTLPRGWQRTYPHLLTMEAVRGFEFVTFEQGNADRQASHSAMLPFTRNLFDPMDFTPVCLGGLPGKVKRRTTQGFELALSVLFLSGIQHYPELPEAMAKLPPALVQVMREIPSVWDETRFLAGYPGKDVALARRSGDRWYVAGINGEDCSKTLSLNLASLGHAGRGACFLDQEGGAGLVVSDYAVAAAQMPGADSKVTPAGVDFRIRLLPQGGFLLVLEAARAP